MAAERVWGARRWLVIAAACGVGAQRWALVVQPVGAGSSVVVFGLAASLAARSLRLGRGRQRVWAAVCLLGAALLAVGDLHGWAAVISAATGWWLAGRTRR